MPPWNQLFMHNFKLDILSCINSQSSAKFSLNLLSLSLSENQTTTMLHDNLNAARHPTNSLIWMYHRRILKNAQNGFFKGILLSFLLFQRMAHRSNLWSKVLAVVEQQYIPKVPNPVQHMAIFYHSVAFLPEPNRDVLKLPFRGYV